MAKSMRLWVSHPKYLDCKGLVALWRESLLARKVLKGKTKGWRQKFYYDFELKVRLKNAGFRSIRFSRVFYPWQEGISDYAMFKGRPKMRDWFVSAEK